jgi:hypothetical protein
MTLKVVELTQECGGKLGQTIIELMGKAFKCHCGTRIDIDGFVGYQHGGGLADKDGTKYWLFLECPHCEYQWSWSKIEVMIRKMEGLEQEEGDYARHPIT